VFGAMSVSNFSILQEIHSSAHCFGANVLFIIETVATFNKSKQMGKLSGDFGNCTAGSSLCVGFVSRVEIVRLTHFKAKPISRGPEEVIGRN
jgi:hypothetical protein